MKIEEELERLQEQHEDDRLWIESMSDEIKFYRALIDYLAERAIGDKSQVIEAVAGNDHNWLIGYVKVEKSLNSMQQLILKFNIEGDECKYLAEWQPSDNYACYQTCGYGDDYSGFLLFPTYKDDEYFCIGYTC